MEINNRRVVKLCTQVSILTSECYNYVICIRFAYLCSFLVIYFATGLDPIGLLLTPSLVEWKIFTSFTYLVCMIVAASKLFKHLGLLNA